MRSGEAVNGREFQLPAQLEICRPENGYEKQLPAVTCYIRPFLVESKRFRLMRVGKVGNGRRFLETADIYYYRPGNCYDLAVS
jgi:hypothetical protein